MDEKDQIQIDLELEFAEKLSERLRALRAPTGLSQEAIAHRAGISTYTYHKYEKGLSNPTKPMNPKLSHIIALARVYNISPWDLIRFDDLQSYSFSDQ